jgi:MFS transporter, DHA2 family, multidrug resistance protein
MTLGLVALPFYLQHGLGQDAWTTGLYLTPWPLTTAIAAPVTGRFATQDSGAWLCAVGGVVLTAGLLGAALWPLHGHALPLAFFTMLCGLGFGLFQVPNNRNMLLSAPRERSGAAGGMQGTARLTGQTAGAIIMTVLFTLTSVDAAPRVALAAASLLTLAAGLVSILRANPITAVQDCPADMRPEAGTKSVLRR